MSGDKEDPGFASRWSRLKQEAKTVPEEVEPVAEADPEVPDTRTDEEVLEELGLPDPDTLKPGDNFAAFMAKAVPARLRNRALRKLWLGNPALANLDELLDYGDDFTDAANVLGAVQTSYEVGKGFANKMAELSGNETESVPEPSGKPAVEAGEEPAVADEQTTADNDAVTGPAEPDSPPGVSCDETAGQAIPEADKPVRKRMRFRLAEE